MTAADQPRDPATPESGRAPASARIPRLVVRTEVHPSDGVSLGKVLPRVAPQEVTAWIRRREGMVGWGRAASVTLVGEESGPDRWERLSQWWRQVAQEAREEVVTDSSVPAGGDGSLPRGAGLVAWASMAFSDDSPEGSVLVVPEVVVGVKDDVAWVTRIEVAGEATEGATNEGAAAEGATPAGIPQRSDDPPSAPTRIEEGPGGTPAEGWPAVVQRGIDAIRSGRADKVVLARDVVATAPEPLDVRWLLHRLVGAYPDTWTFAVDGLVGATPEMLVRLDDGHVFSRVLAGTASRAADVEDDQHAADDLLASRKDLSEHAFAVESVVERLSPLCSAVVAPRSPALLTLPNVFHLVSDLDGRAVPGTTVLELAGALHPSAAVGGTPREVALDLIRELEGRDRGRYAGPVGWMDARGDGDMGIALRTGQIEAEDPCSLRMWAGGGIMADSDPQAEYAETGAKLAPMRSALSGD